MAAQQKKVYLITGASRGLGAELTSQLLHRGQARVLAGARSPDTSPALQRLAQEYPGDLQTLVLDVTNEQSIKAAAAAATSVCPHGIDVLVNNAGIGGSEAMKLTLDQRGQCKQIFNISSFGGSCATAVGLVTMGPDHSWAAFRGRCSGYAVSKAALNMETICQAQQLYAEGFTVVALDPGWSDTDMGNRAANRLAVLSATLSAQPDRMHEGDASGGGSEALKSGSDGRSEALKSSRDGCGALKPGSSGLKPSLTVADSIKGILAVMNKVTLDDSAKLLNWQGQVVPW